MGAWGTTLYANDTAQDVRDTYLDLLREDIPDQEALSQTLDTLHEYPKSDLAPLFWLALADTMWTYGRLTPEVEREARAVIDEKEVLEEWRERKNGEERWLAILNKVEAKLNSPMPPAKKLRKRKPLNQNPWNTGDVYAFQISGNYEKTAPYAQKYVVMQKIAEEPELGDIKMRVLLFYKLFDELPTIEELKTAPLLPAEYSNTFTAIPRRPPTIDEKRWAEMVERWKRTDRKEVWMSVVLEWYKAKDYPSDQLFYIGQMPPRELNPKNQGRNNYMDWYSYEKWAVKLFQTWENETFAKNEEGVYMYLPKE